MKPHLRKASQKKYTESTFILFLSVYVVKVVGIIPENAGYWGFVSLFVYL